MVYLVNDNYINMLWNNATSAIYISILASFGGIFGLCLGGSVISLVELMYFFTLRLYNKIINQSSSRKQSDAKRVSISNNVKTIEINPKSFLFNIKPERLAKTVRIKPPLLNSGTTLLGKTPYHEYNKPGVLEFLK